jgi:hypothetical protein
MRLVMMMIAGELTGGEAVGTGDIGYWFARRLHWGGSVNLAFGHHLGHPKGRTDCESCGSSCVLKRRDLPSVRPEEAGAATVLGDGVG